MKTKSVTIIGSGLGGLACGVILSKEGYRVTVLEKNKVAGGCLQSFRRKGRLIDTGMHYVGSLDDGEVLNQYFRYFGVLSRLKLKRLDEECFDVINLGGEDYRLAMGYDNFIRTLSEQFPAEKDNIGRYAEKIRSIGSQISVENMKRGMLSSNPVIDYGVAGSAFIKEAIGDRILQNVLAGNIVLYGGIRNVTSLYHHAMINHSNIQGAYRFVDGSQQLADIMSDVIRENGGEVLTDHEVTGIETDGTYRVKRVVVNGTKTFESDVYISDIHPLVTFRLLDKTPAIRKAFISRLESLPNSYGIFIVYLLMKPRSMPYFNRNFYHYRNPDVWHSGERGAAADTLLISAQSNSVDPEYAQVVSLMAPMYIDEVAQWEGGRPDKRSGEYYGFKERRAAEIIDVADSYLPGLKGNAEHVFSTSPLSFKDYTYTPEGSAYGIIKDVASPLQTFIPARTKLDNFLLTGQNLNVHGALGVTVTAAATCAELLGIEYLAKKIGNA